MQKELYQRYLIPYMTNGVMSFAQFLEALDEFNIFDSAHEIERYYLEEKLKDNWFKNTCLSLLCLRRFSDEEKRLKIALGVFKESDSHSNSFFGDAT